MEAPENAVYTQHCEKRDTKGYSHWRPVYVAIAVVVVV